MASRMLSFWRSGNSHKYTKMEDHLQDNMPITGRSSLDGSLDGIASDVSTQVWEDFKLNKDYGSQLDGPSVPSPATASSITLFVPGRISTQGGRGPFKRLKRMCTKFPYRDMSWLVGVVFSFGSSIFVINGFFLLLPLIGASTNFSNEVPYATPASSVLGTIVFLIGGWVGVLEGLNLKRGGDLVVTEGVAVEVFDMSELQPKTQDDFKSEPSSSSRSIPVQNSSEIATSPHETTSTQPALLGSKNFIHWPSRQELISIYLWDLCFLTGLVQMIGAIIFSVATITSIPGVIDSSNTLLVNTTNLLPAALGGLLFLVASILQVLSAQEKLFVPRVARLEWWVGFWNVVGSAGFTLAGALPFLGTRGASFQATLADIWGSWAFLFGSLLQLYVVMGNYP